jgi:integrase
MTRRARETGSIYQRSDGRWAAAIRHDGRRISLYGSTRKEVTGKLAEAGRSIAETGAVRSDRLTVDAYLDQWLEAVKPSLRPRTLGSYRDVLRLHVRPVLGRHVLARLTAADVQNVISAQLAAGRSARSVQYVHALIRAALGKAERWGLVARNVARLVDAPRVRRSEVRPLTPDQSAALLASVSGTQDETLYLAALGLGLRQGELLGLRWADVDLDAGTVAVRHTLQRIDGAPVLADPKTDKSRRTVTAPGPVVVALREHRRRQIADRLAAGPEWSDGDFVFTRDLGEPLDGSTVLHRFQRQLAAVGLPRVSFHSLRHACASYLLAAGVPMKVVQEVLGHSQLSTTADVYSHVAPELQREAAARLGAILERRATS